MAISDHKTMAVFDRYDIVSAEDLNDAARKRKKYQELQEKQLRNSYSGPQNEQGVTVLHP